MAEFSVTQIEQIARNAIKNNLDRYRQAIERYVVPVYDRGATAEETRAALYRANKEYHDFVNHEIYYNLPASNASNTFLEQEKLAGTSASAADYFKKQVRAKMAQANQDPDPETGLWAGTVFYYVVLTYLSDLQLPFEENTLANEINQQQYQLERTVFSDIESYLRQRGSQPATSAGQGNTFVQTGPAQQANYFAPPSSPARGNGTLQSGAAQQSFPQNGAPYNEPTSRLMGMKWYWFVTNIQTILSAIVFVLYALIYFTGSLYSTNYGIPAEKFYSVYPALKIVDSCYAVVLLLLAAFSLVVRHGLKKRYKNAPFYYMASYAVPLIASFLYTIEIGLIFGVSALTSILFIQIPVMGGFIVLNYVYFNKRRHLFPNTSPNYTTFIKVNLILAAVVAFLGIVGTFGTF